MGTAVAEQEETQHVWQLPERLGLVPDLDRLRAFLVSWVSQTDPEVRPMIECQLSGRAKYFRPATAFACWRAVSDDPVPQDVLHCVAGVELLHNVSLIVDDILDRSRYRRGLLSLHCRFGFLPALMASEYVMAATSRLVADDPYSVHLLAELMQRLALPSACNGVCAGNRWAPRIGEGSRAKTRDRCSEICARAGTRDDRLRTGQAAGNVYHGCDDVADVRGTTALGGGSARDIEDAILTLPVAVAMRDPEAALMFRNSSPSNREALTSKLVAALPEAEDYLDTLAAEAENEAQKNARNPERLLALIRDTRLLSRA